MIVHATTFDGIVFIEGTPAKYQPVRPIQVEIGGVVQQAQLKNLDDVKRQMAQEAKACGGNSIVDFEYGQRSVGWFRSLFQLDDINWYGSGTIAIIPRAGWPGLS